MKILAASSVLAAREAFSTLGAVTVLPDRDITRDAVLALRPDALVVRSKTRIGTALADGTTLRFAATATAGTDHFDLPALASLGVATASAPGCNANAVAEYTLTALSLLAAHAGRSLPDLPLAVVGCGHVGSLVFAKARALGLHVRVNDPPLALASPSAPFPLEPLADILSGAGAVTFHVPLSDPPDPFPTRRLVSADLLSALPPGALLVNASRGPVADSGALAEALASRRLGGAVLDVWNGEPAPHPVLSRALHVTPHIAGYSLEGLLNGTLQTYRALCRFLGVRPTWTPSLPPAEPLDLDLAGVPPPLAFARTLAALCPIPDDSADWLRVLGNTHMDALPAAFAAFRQSRATRREFPSRPLRLRHAPAFLPDLLSALSVPLA